MRRRKPHDLPQGEPSLPVDTQDWRPDHLGPDFESLTLPLQPDDQGEVVATLVRHRPASATAARDSAAGFDVLYVHGWSDYFFHPELATFWTALGGRFYAIDLRKYGRSLRPHQTPGFIADLATYDEDIEAALAVIGHPAPETDPTRPSADDAETGPGTAPPHPSAGAPTPRRRLLLMGHSTGGLTFSLWVARHRGRAHGLVLNSPWLEFQAGQKSRALLTPVIGVEAQRRPLARLPNVDLGFYTRSVSKKFDGEWDYNLEWRPEHGFRTTTAWLAAILQGHATVAEGLGIDIPVLVLLSAQSTLTPVWSERMRHTDTAIDVTAVARRSLDLGSLTTISRIDGALHDVVLSPSSVRAEAYDHMERWACGFFRPPPRGEPPPPKNLGDRLRAWARNPGHPKPHP